MLPAGLGFRRSVPAPAQPAWDQAFWRMLSGRVHPFPCVRKVLFGSGTQLQHICLAGFTLLLPIVLSHISWRLHFAHNTFQAASLRMDNSGHNHKNQPKSRGCAEKALEEGVLSMFPYLPIEPGRLRSDPSGGTAGQHRPHAAVRLVFMPPNISTVWITSSFLTETSPLLSQPTDHLSAHSELHNLLVATAYRKSSERKYLVCSKCL